MTNNPRGAPPVLLPDELLWADGGHASDVVLTVLADGQTDIVPPIVIAHVDRCSICTTHLGHAALLSLHVDRQLADRTEHDLLLVPSARRPMPWLPIGLGLVVGALGLVPTVIDDSTSPLQVLRDLPLFLRGLGALARPLNEPGSAVGLFVTYSTAVLLTIVGAAAVRLLPKKETPR